MKLLITLAALAALSLQAQQPTAAKIDKTTPAPKQEVKLTAEQKLAIRDAQFAQQQMKEYFEKVVQPALDKNADYIRLKKRAEATNEAVVKVTADVAKICADCKIDFEAMTVVHAEPEAAKPEAKP